MKVTACIKICLSSSQTEVVGKAKSLRKATCDSHVKFEIPVLPLPQQPFDFSRYVTFSSEKLCLSVEIIQNRLIKIAIQLYIE